jgi:transposase
MALRPQLSFDQWKQVQLVIEAERRAGRRGGDDRRFIEAVLWWRRTGVPWRALPSDFPPMEDRLQSI